MRDPFVQGLQRETMQAGHNSAASVFPINFGEKLEF